MKIKKFIAVGLAALLVSAVAVTGVSAKKFKDVKTEDTYAQQIDILSEIGVIVGTTESEFDPETPVTREQMALLLYRLMLGKNNAGETNTSPFTDLYEPAYNGAISWASANGYILGTGEKTFEPKGGISLQDAMTMLVRALGQSNDKMNAGYPWTFIDAGVKLDLDNNMSGIGYTDTLTRAQVAGLLYNALTAEYLVAKTVGGTTAVESTTIIEYVFGYSIEDAIVTSTNSYALPGHAPVVKNNHVGLTYTNAAGQELTIYTDFAELGLEGSANDWLGRSVKVTQTSQRFTP